MKTNTSTFKPFYRRNLPHLQPKGGIFFVTFRLKNSIPYVLLNKLRAQEKSHQNMLIDSSQSKPGKDRYFQYYDRVLDEGKQGPTFLKEPPVASLVKDQLHSFDGIFYDLIAFCIMPNHVHLLIDTSIALTEEDNEVHTPSLMQIMKRIKGPTAVNANRLLQRKGPFWQRESYDRLVRDELELNNTIAYILENPVKARLTEDWTKWPHSFYKYS